MSKLIELHLLQSFAPSNLNRDDTGAPKDCYFGGVRRARISSQCVKRAARLHFSSANLFEPGEVGKRTRLIRDSIAEQLAREQGVDFEKARAVAVLAVESVGFKIKQKGETQYLVFWGPDETAELVRLCREHWAELAEISPESIDDAAIEKGRKKKGGLAKGVSDDFKKMAEKVLTVPKAADIALFGRMLADLPQKNVNAACQVAHALSTHKTEMEMDYFTAVDDLQKLESEEGAGAGMIGSVSYNSATFYRYANIHHGQLVDNLRGDEELARKTVRGFITASLEAVPTGKQNTFAAFNPPSFALALVRDEGMPLSLANAFEKPVRADRRNGGGFIEPSLTALDGYWNSVAGAYGIRGDAFYLVLGEGELPAIGADAARVSSVSELVEKTLAALS